MGNRAVIIPVCVSLLIGAMLSVMPQPAAAASRDSVARGIIEMVNKRLCDRQERLHGRVRLVNPDRCESTPPEETDEPTVTLSISPTTIQAGESATLTWTSSDATSCTAYLGWSGSKPTNGSMPVSPTETTTYQLDCTGPGGVGSDDAVVTVIVDEPDEPVIQFSGSPMTIALGESATLTWSSTNATSCAGSDGWSGAKNLSGNMVVTPSMTTNYTLECSGDDGTASTSVTITVTAAPEDPVPTLSFAASRTTVHENSAREATTTLSWDSADASSCTASGAAEWSGSKDLDGSLEVTPVADATYVLTCTGSGGSVEKSVAVDFVPEETPTPMIGHVVISEVLYDAASTTVGSENFNEWVEVYNGTNAAVDLQGWMIGDAAGEDTITSSFVVNAGGFAIIAASTTPEGIPGGVPVYVLFSSIGSNGFTNSGEGARLLNPEEIVIDQVGYGTGTITPVVGIPAEAADHDGHSIRRIQLTADTDTAADWEDAESPTPGE